MKAVLAITTYNCAIQIERVLDAIDNTLAEKFVSILVIDNISTDNTEKVALLHKKRIKNLHVLRNNKNYSLGGSHKVAFLHAKKINATHVAILHGDDQAVASELNNLLDVVNKFPEVGAVLGARFMKGSKLEGYDWKRIMGNRVLNILYTILTGRRCYDLGSGLNIFKMDAFKDHTYLQFADKLTFNFEMLLYLINSRTKIIYYPITWRESDQVSNARNFNIAKIAITNLFKWRFGLLKYDKTNKPEDYQSKEIF